MTTGHFTVGLLAIVLAMGLFGACAEEKQEISDEIRSFEIIKINPPKHFRVDLRDKETGVIHYGVGISKHCNRYREVKLNSTVRLRMKTFEQGASGRTSYQIFASKICPGGS